MSFAFSRVDSDSITLIGGGAGGIDLSGQSPWTFYDAQDFPAGCYYSGNQTTATLDATLTLPQAMASATTYYVFFWFLGYDSANVVKCTVGGVNSTAVDIDDRDFNAYWTDRVTVVPGSTTPTMTVTITKAPGTVIKCLFQGIYITTDSAVTVLRDGTAVVLTVPPTEDNAAVKGNLIPNGGFEAGVDPAWILAGYKTTTILACVDNTVGHSGITSLKIPCGAASNASGLTTGTAIQSRVYHLKPNRKYTLSYWAKTSTGTTATSANMSNTFIPPTTTPPFDPQWIVDTSGTNATSYEPDFTATTTWKRFYTTGYLKKYPQMDYLIQIGVNGFEGDLYIDDIQLEEGDLTAFAEMNTLETIITTGKTGNVYHTDDTLTGTATTSNSTGGGLTKTLNWEIYDHFNRLIRSGSTSVTVAPNTVSTASFDVSTTGMQGIFRLVYWYNNENGTEKELSYSIVPNFATAGVDTASYISMNGSGSIAHQLESLQRLGARWFRSSTAAWMRWDQAEAVEGVFVYYDAEVSLVASTYSFSILGTFLEGTQGGLPAYANDGTGKPILSKLSTFIGTLVDHYRATIKYWEIFNEPAYAPSYYAQMLKTACDAIEAVETAHSLGADYFTIVGMGGLPATTIQSVIDELDTQYLPGWDWRDHVDILSGHMYHGGQDPDAYTTIVDNYKPVWQTESGLYDFGSYLGPYSNWGAPGKAIMPYIQGARFYIGMTDNPNKMINVFANCTAAKITHFTYYDARYGGGTGVYLAGGARETTLFEYDNSVRAKGVALSIAGSFLDKATTSGDVSPDAESNFWLFTNASDDFAVIMSSGNILKQVVLSGISHGDVLLYDRFGNALTFSGVTIPYGRSPVYLVANGISLATLDAALSGGTVSARTDVVPPNLSIVDGPRAPLDSGSALRMRWIAIDEDYLPNLGEITAEQASSTDEPNPDAILYNYKLNGYTDWSGWVENTWVDYVGVPDGLYTFQVQTKDAAGNESAIAQRTIQLGETTLTLLGAALT